MNHCTVAKAEGPDAAATSHHTSNPRPTPQAAPVMRLAPKSDLFAFEFEDFQLEGYAPHPPIKAPVAV